MPYKDRQAQLEYMKEYHRKHGRPDSRKAHKVDIKIREEIFTLLGNQCSNPFNLEHGNFLTDKRCLQIDHVNGNGLKERKIFPSYSTFLKHVLEEITKGSREYQLLCANCNWIKRREHNEKKKH
jgi:hypothetical protein